MTAPAWTDLVDVGVRERLARLKETSDRRYLAAAVAEIDRLRAEVERLRADCRSIANQAEEEAKTGHACDQLLRDRIRVLTKALRRYGAHEDGPDGCRANDDGPDTCDCGLDAALAGKREEDVEGGVKFDNIGLIDVGAGHEPDDGGGWGSA